LLIHDLVVRTAIDLGYPIRDDLVIDTAEAHRVALAQSQRGAWPAGNGGLLAGSAPYFVYPPPLFGRVDDPFFGFEPPLVSFPPWWTRASEAAGGVSSVAGASAAPDGSSSAGFTLAGGSEAGESKPFSTPHAGPSPIKGKLELTVDMSGQVFLRGVVASEEARRVIEEEARNTPGVTRVFSELQVQAGPSTETPPPPPRPYLPSEPQVVPARPAQPPASVPAVKAEEPRAVPRPTPSPRRDAEPRKAPAPELAMARDSQKLTRRTTEALAKRPSLAGLPISVQSRGDVVTVSGKVPSAYDAMLTYRTVEQIPGVREIIDLLEFPVPDENHPNPLRQKGRPEDLEPYLTSQVRRHLGDLAHVDRLRVTGDSVEIRGTLLHGEDQNRVQAILRSMPLLRDFRLDPVFHTE
jgi:hypothetical protein